MGLLDFLTGGGPEKQLRKQARRVANKNAQPEDREAAARWLADNGSPEAILGLLGRFDVTIENQMKDVAEKEFVFDLLVQLGSRTVEPARRWVLRCRQIGFPLRLVETVGGVEPLLEALYEMLDREAEKEDFKAEPKRQLLIMLAEHRDERVLESARRFLDDFDEGVRYAAAEAILAQGGDVGREDLLEALANEEEESNRLRVRIAEAFHNRRWSLGDARERIARNPPSGWTVEGNHIRPTS